MGRHKKVSQEPNAMPASKTELQPIIEEFVSKLRSIENEIDTLKEDQKELIEQYSDRLDTKTLKLAIKMVDFKAKIERKDTFDMMVEILEKV
jgi:uncharacterized protein (UPF0335 family)